MRDQRLGAAGAEPALKDLLALLGRDRKPLAADLKGATSPVPPTANVNSGVRQRVLDGVVNEVHHDLPEHLIVAEDRQMPLEALPFNMEGERFLIEEMQEV